MQATFYVNESGDCLDYPENDLARMMVKTVGNEPTIGGKARKLAASLGIVWKKVNPTVYGGIKDASWDEKNADLDGCCVDPATGKVTNAVTGKKMSHLDTGSLWPDNTSETLDEVSMEYLDKTNCQCTG